MNRLSCFAVGVFLTAAVSQTAFAQRGTVQQPVVSRFSVGTTVSVPDRGRAHLASVSRAGDGRKSFGPFSPGSSRGMFRDHSSSSVGVTIHDLDEMDRRLLGTATRISRSRHLSANAEHAWRSLVARHARTATSTRTTRPYHRSEPRVTQTFPKELPPSVGRSIAGERSVTRRKSEPDGYAGRFLADAVRAENRGAISLARNYYRVAAKLGSVTAKNRLTEIVRRQRFDDLNR